MVKELTIRLVGEQVCCQQRKAVDDKPITKPLTGFSVKLDDGTVGVATRLGATVGMEVSIRGRTEFGWQTKLSEEVEPGLFRVEKPDPIPWFPLSSGGEL